jgi:hypothetical protein
MVRGGEVASSSGLISFFIVVQSLKTLSSRTPTTKTSIFIASIYKSNTDFKFVYQLHKQWTPLKVIMVNIISFCKEPSIHAGIIPQNNA